MGECAKWGCRLIQTTCVTCGRVICTKCLPPMPEWIYPDEMDPSTWWPADQRVLSIDSQGWIVIVKMTAENGFELDNGSEAGIRPIAWMPLPLT